MVSNEFEDYFEGVLDLVSDSVGSRGYARLLGKRNYFRIKTGYYEDENPDDVAKDIVFSTEESLNESTILNEAKGITEPVRMIVRDIVNIVKSKQYGLHYLPEDLTNSNMFEYDFKKESEKFGLTRPYNVPPFSIQLIYNEDVNINEPYVIDGLIIENDVIEITLTINPKYFPQLMYDLIADINDVVVHEIEHIFQDHGMRPEEEMSSLIFGEEPPDDYTYYTQKHEVPAQIQGLRRIAKLRKQSIEQVIRDWFKRNKSSHKQNDEDVEKIINHLLLKYKERYGTV